MRIVKKMLLLSLAIVFLASCKDDSVQEQADMLQLENDRLRTEYMAKDSTLNALFASYNEIEENLAVIRERESLIRGAGTGDLSTDAKNKIAEDLTMIAELMEKNRQTIASLRRQLRSSDVKLQEFEKTVELLTNTIEEKDAEIIQLSNQLAEKNVELTKLANQIQSISSDLASKSEKLSQQDADLHKAWYVIGTERELREKGIITREGGFVGIGRTRSLAEDFNIKHFKEVDIRTLKNIPINQRAANIVTVHPSNSYNLIGERNIESLEIIDYNSFWHASRHLVIVVK
jgi:uncharacterized protein (DUF3084 family)